MTTHELKQAWEEIKSHLKQRANYPLANHPNPQSVQIVDEFISSLDSVARISDIEKFLP